jgi:hypothetical protein
LRPHVAAKGIRFDCGEHHRHIKHSGSFRKSDGVVNDCLSVEIRRSKEHLWLVVDERHHAIVWGQQTLFTSFCSTVVLRHHFLPFRIELNILETHYSERPETPSGLMKLTALPNLLQCLRGTFADFLSALCDFPSGLASLLAGLFGRISYFFSSLPGTFGSRLANGLGRNPGGCLTAEGGTEAEPSR